MMMMQKFMAFWKMALPLFNPNFDNPLALYGDMAQILTTHNNAVDYV